MKRRKLQNLTLSALFLAIGYLLPFLTGQIREIGNMLLPMHLPVLLCGLVCGPYYGLAVGAVLPLTRSLFFGMPLLYPSAIAMSFELAAYGVVIGFLQRRFVGRSVGRLYPALLATMLAGRAVWGLATALLMGLGKRPYSFAAFFTGGVVKALPGILLQLILIPLLFAVLVRTKSIKLKKEP